MILRTVDAVGDVLVYLADYCNRNGIDMQSVGAALAAEFHPSCPPREPSLFPEPA
jgi:hypothetical protein